MSDDTSTPAGDTPESLLAQARSHCQADCREAAVQALEQAAQLAPAPSLPTVLDTSQPYPNCVPQLTQEAADTLADAYLGHVTVLVPQATRVTDKLPANCFNLGLIRLLLPQAALTHCRRNPLDTCLSCYCQQFAHRHDYAYDLADLGHSYRGYR